METGSDRNVEIDGTVIIHQNLPGLWVREHSHPQHELFIPLKGGFRLRLGSSMWTLHPGSMFWMRGGEPHSFESSDDDAGERLILLFPEKLRSSDAPIRHVSGPLAHQEIIAAISTHVVQKGPSRSSSALVESLHFLLSEALEKQTSAPSLLPSAAPVDDRVAAALQILRVRFTEEISVEELAASVKTTTRTLLRAFTRDLGLSPKQVLIRIRIQEACRLLRDTQLSITDVGYESGFGSLNHFNECFQERIGLTPSEYREHALGKVTAPARRKK